MIIQDKRSVLERKGAWILAESIQQAAAEQSRVLLAVPGGRSVVSILKNLKNEPVDWEKVHLFMVDERLVPVDHQDSNFRLVSSCLEDVADRMHLHSFSCHGGDGRSAAADYEKQLRDLGGSFDITLLASGEDGHVAGLFPDHETVRSADDFFILTSNAPKPPPERMSSSRKLIERSKTAVLLFLGREKHDAFSLYLDRKETIEGCPAKIVDSVQNRFVLTDCLQKQAVIIGEK